MKKYVYWVLSLVILLVTFVLLFCKDTFIHPKDSTISHTSNTIASDFVVKDAFAQIVHIQAKKTVNYLSESETWVSWFNNSWKTKIYKAILWDGSGIFVRKDGLILTSRHVVADPNLRYEIVFPDGTVFVADKIRYHDTLDLALIKIKNKNWNKFRNNTIANFVEDLDTISIGNKVFTVWVLSGVFPQVASTGIINQKHVDFNYGNSKYTDMLLSDVVVHPGSSWGPLFNTSWEVIAVITAQNEFGWAYAIPFSQEDLVAFITSLSIY